MEDTAPVRTPVRIPSSHLDLVDGPYIAALTTITPDGYPHTTPIWCNRKDDHIFINVMRGYRKERNMSLNPHVSLLISDPQDPLRNLEIRGCVLEMTEDGAVEHNDELARLYLNNPSAHFFGDCVPAKFQARYTPVRVTIVPTHVRVESRKNDICNP